VAAVLALAGCAVDGPRLAPLTGDRLPPSVELAATPFFAQRDYQCGPAALATVLVASGIDVTPGALVPEVFLPGREGSLQTELVAATRARGRLPYVVEPRLDALIAQVAAGLPVLVLQKLGAGPWPGWHYAVLVGYDSHGDRLLLRSGTEARVEMGTGKFLATWDRAGRWGMVVVPPGEFPANPTLTGYMDAAAGVEAVGRLDDAAAAYQAAAARWPAEALPRLGLANVAYARGDISAAERGFRAASRLDPRDPVALNNRAQVLLQLGCPALARRVVDAAWALAEGGSHADAIATTRSQVGEVPGGVDPSGCPAD
jgi:hypothetical protein